jgi:hypothetical protein
LPEPPSSSDRFTYAALDELVRRYAGTATETPSPKEPLTRYEYRCFSQNGEDGVLAELLARASTTNRWFVEFGIQSGLEGNCVFLADVLGWSGLFMESDADAANELRRKYAANPRVQTREAHVTVENIQQLFAEAHVPAEPDVLSIDVDGNDYWIWQAQLDYSPRLVVIEYNAQWPLDARWVQPYDPDRTWRGTDNYGASLGALRSLGEDKGYRLVHTELTGNNAFFVRDDLSAVLPEPDVVPLRAANHYLLGASHPAHPQPAPAITDLDGQ